jgi:hypothetical protein
MSALAIARGLAGAEPFAVIDTERGRALHYGDDFQPWHHAELHPPFRPDAYSEAITAADAANYPVIVIDSFSHEHAGEGGLIDWQAEEVDRMAGDDYKKREAVKLAAWIAPKSSHKRLVSHLLQLKAHLIICLRAEQQIEIVKEQGKTVIRPKRSLTGLDGWVPIAEKTLAFELTASLLLTPDAPGFPKPIKLPDRLRPFVPLDQPLDETVGLALAEWAAGGQEKVDTAALEERFVDVSVECGADRAKMVKVARQHAGDDAWFEEQIAKGERALKAKVEQGIETVAEPDPESQFVIPEGATA